MPAPADEARPEGSRNGRRENETRTTALHLDRGDPGARPSGAPTRGGVVRRRARSLARAAGADRRRELRRPGHGAKRYETGLGRRAAPSHQPRGRPSRKNPPVGPSSGSIAAHTTLAAPSATGRPPLPPMSVATQPGHTAFTSILWVRSSAASMRVSALRAAFERL